jgi:CBS domain-containing protein
MLNLKISDIMNEHPVKVKSDTSIRNVAHLLLRNRINGVLVIDVNDGRLLGVFTTHDLVDLMGASLTRRSQKMQALRDTGNQPVGHFLKGKLTTLSVDDNAVKALGLMHKKNAVTIPVLDGDFLVGVVGRHDIINIAFA